MFGRGLLDHDSLLIINGSQQVFINCVPSRFYFTRFRYIQNVVRAVTACGPTLGLQILLLNRSKGHDVTLLLVYLLFELLDSLIICPLPLVPLRLAFLLEGLPIVFAIESLLGARRINGLADLWSPT
jgi:hypothetical protein